MGRWAFPNLWRGMKKQPRKVHRKRKAGDFLHRLPSKLRQWPDASFWIQAWQGTNSKLCSLLLDWKMALWAEGGSHGSKDWTSDSKKESVSGRVFIIYVNKTTGTFLCTYHIVQKIKAEQVSTKLGRYACDELLKNRGYVRLMNFTLQVGSGLSVGFP